MSVEMSDGALLWTVSTELPGAPVVAFVHGGPGLWDNLGPVASLVADRVSTVRYDQRGCGRSSPVDDYRMDRFVDDLDELRVHAGVERWLVFGHSFGATLALTYAAAHPDRVDALVLADGTGLDWAEFRGEYHATADARRTPDQQRRLDVLTDRQRTGDEEIEWRTLHSLPDFADPGTAWELTSQDARTPYPINVDCNLALNAETAAMAPDMRAWCAAVTVPVLVVRGESDPRPIGGVRRLVDALPDARQAVLEGCGHEPWRERPDLLGDVLGSFLTDLV